MSTQSQVTDLLLEYNDRRHKAEKAFKVKQAMIRDSRLLTTKQIMPSSELTRSNAAYAVGNDPDGTGASTTSRYVFPIGYAIQNRMVQSLTTGNFRFEIEAHNPVGNNIKRAFTKTVLKVYTYEGIKKEFIRGAHFLVNSGTWISQTFSKKKKEMRIDQNGKRKPHAIGRTFEMRVYDPQTALLDPNATPGKVAETSDFIIVTLGKWSAKHIEKEYGVTEAELKASGAKLMQTYGTMTADRYDEQLSIASGFDKASMEGYLVREYYTNDGMVYLIVADSYILKSYPNHNGIADRIPFNIAPLELDPDSPYGLTLKEMIGPSGQMINTAINQIVDNNAMNNNSPFFTFSGLFDRQGYTINSWDPNEIVELDPAQLMSLSGNSNFDINNLITRFQIPEVTNGANMMIETGLQAIWFSTGLNPTALSGIQDKQIRVADVASMVQGASLRNDSGVVVNMENFCINPMCWDILRIMQMYYEDFPDLKAHGVEPEFLNNIKDVRVVNGSFLPADAMEYMQKTQYVLNLALQIGSIDPIIALKDHLDSLGIGDIERLFRSGLEILNDNQLASLITMLQENDAQQVLQGLTQMAMERAGERQSTGRAAN